MNPRSEEDRIKIYDSDDRYLDYFSLEELFDAAAEMETTVEEEYATRLKAIREEENVGTFVSLLTSDCVAITNVPQEENDYVNRIGNLYLLIRE